MPPSRTRDCTQLSVWKKAQGTPGGPILEPSSTAERGADGDCHLTCKGRGKKAHTLSMHSKWHRRRSTLFGLKYPMRQKGPHLHSAPGTVGGGSPRSSRSGTDRRAGHGTVHSGHQGDQGSMEPQSMRVPSRPGEFAAQGPKCIVLVHPSESLPC